MGEEFAETDALLIAPRKQFLGLPVAMAADEFADPIVELAYGNWRKPISVVKVNQDRTFRLNLFIQTILPGCFGGGRRCDIGQSCPIDFIFGIDVR